MEATGKEMPLKHLETLPDTKHNGHLIPVHHLREPNLNICGLFHFHQGKNWNVYLVVYVKEQWPLFLPRNRLNDQLRFDCRVLEAFSCGEGSQYKQDGNSCPQVDPD